MMNLILRIADAQSVFATSDLCLRIHEDICLSLYIWCIFARKWESDLQNRPKASLFNIWPVPKTIVQYLFVLVDPDAFFAGTRLICFRNRHQKSSSSHIWSVYEIPLWCMFVLWLLMISSGAEEGVPEKMSHEKKASPRRRCRARRRYRAEKKASSWRRYREDFVVK